MTRSQLSPSAVILSLVLAGLTPSVRAQEPPAGENTSLSKATQNPVGDLIGIPFQFNYFSGGGLADRTLYNLNIQPVLPFSMGRKWSLIARTIIPYLNLPGPGITRVTGIGDIQQQFFVTPAQPKGLIWGIGPIFSVPTATNQLAWTGDWALGPGRGPQDDRALGDWRAVHSTLDVRGQRLRP